MAKSKRVSVSTAKLAEAGEALEVAGTVAAVEGRPAWSTARRIWRWQRPPPRSVWAKSRPARAT